MNNTVKFQKTVRFISIIIAALFVVLGHLIFGVGSLEETSVQTFLVGILYFSVCYWFIYPDLKNQKLSNNDKNKISNNRLNLFKNIRSISLAFLFLIFAFYFSNLQYKMSSDLRHTIMEEIFPPIMLVCVIAVVGITIYTMYTGRHYSHENASVVRDKTSFKDKIPLIASIIAVLVILTIVAALMISLRGLPIG
ncbi:hypothetical protein CVV38_02150 [Candidatus Peregrinibacteria bacterium HGW-Peregrinibacteria-1]|jgi:uncharacterized membrane protein YidH (DUF202 family)|nr:MAG: hypothetical protein CVV38_02150 [Candidatus Peregrinibacteria bacterium HGW-Peregrinibacteria-1]